MAKTTVDWGFIALKFAYANFENRPGVTEMLFGNTRTNVLAAKLNCYATGTCVSDFWFAFL